MSWPLAYNGHGRCHTTGMTCTPSMPRTPLPCGAQRKPLQTNPIHCTIILKRIQHNRRNGNTRKTNHLRDNASDALISTVLCSRAAFIGPHMQHYVRIRLAVMRGSMPMRLHPNQNKRSRDVPPDAPTVRVTMAAPMNCAQAPNRKTLNTQRARAHISKPKLDQPG